MSETDLHFKLSKMEAEQLLWLLNRSVATLQPEKWPPITQEMVDHLENWLKNRSEE